MVDQAYEAYEQYAAAQKAGVKQLVVQVLKSPEAKKIDFWLGSIHVNAAGLNLVVNALNNGKIYLRIGPLDSGSAAQYGSGDNTYTFPNVARLSTAAGKMEILHESVHAMQDVGGGKVISERGSMFGTDSENEAAAYVAGALFLIYSDGKLGEGSPNLALQALSIAQSIRDTPGAVVPKSDADILRVLIVTHPVYMFDQRISFTTPTSADGVP